MAWFLCHQPALMAIQKIVDLTFAQTDGHGKAEPPRPRFDAQRNAGGARMLADGQRHGAGADLNRPLFGSQRLPFQADRFLERCEHQPCLADSSRRLIAKPAPGGAGRIVSRESTGTLSLEIDDAILA